jgi:Phosphotransferase enzyme family
MDGGTRARAVAVIEAAASPAELFGADPLGAARRYRELARLTHPDAHPGDRRTTDAFAKLADLWRRHQLAARAAVFRGEIANLYEVPAGLLKIVRDPADNDLMRHEAAALARLSDRVDPALRAYFPRLIEARRQTDPSTGVRRRASLIAPLPGFLSLVRVRAAYPGGVDPRDAAWIWRRLLVAIGAAHRAGLIHGAVLPDHVLIDPAEHGLVLIDWCYSGKGPATRLPALVRRYARWYPPEVVAGEVAGPDLDIWLATRCMTELMGGRVPAPMAAFARGCTLTSPRRRPADAWALLAELDEWLLRLYGPRTFRPFAVPA